ncbi:hypothetical protein PHAMO_340005 [Magnetospirillum molischianum DSM 120]|uniref:Uncharacterized protein n=1 Tax=Magnetospirillum molischianum DSM 120 TaxID=1150626 RepID=H8FUU4_MAGML|nr:hypothetical protein PHAMO_340005 [Magnetospirillum molischianum DSM 120]
MVRSESEGTLGHGIDPDNPMDWARYHMSQRFANAPQAAGECATMGAAGRRERQPGTPPYFRLNRNI